MYHIYRRDADLIIECETQVETLEAGVAVEAFFKLASLPPIQGSIIITYCGEQVICSPTYTRGSLFARLKNIENFKQKWAGEG